MLYCENYTENEQLINRFQICSDAYIVAKATKHNMNL